MSVKLGPSHLYLDEIQTIFDALRDYFHSSFDGSPPRDLPNAPDGIWLNVGRALASTPDDLKEATPDELKMGVSLTALSNGGIVEVVLGPRRAEVHTASDRAEARQLAEDIAAHVNSFKAMRIRFGLYRSYLLGTAVLYTISILLVAILVFAAGELTALLFGIIISAVALFSAFPIILQWFLIRSSGLVIVSNRYRNEVRGLSAETKRLVIVGVIASVLGAVISGVFGFWQGLFLK